MIYTFLIFLHIVVSALLITVILLQSGRGGGLAGTLGGGVSTAMFGGQGADKVMTRLTTGLAAAFMVLAILISIASSPEVGQRDSVVRERAAQMETMPLQPLNQVDLPVSTSPLGLPIPLEEPASQTSATDENTGNE
ncbi:MAG: preprotein translocase subunit SecG [Candidatus Marinimicrobia bacterium]|nr:preprotein translocase subunit SecG [Candidatus Neomarinimicrobiota bacterium]